MKTILSTVAFLLLVSLVTTAQTTPTDSTARAQVREIKLSEQYVYADAVSPNSFEEAIQAATEELRIQASTLLAELNYEKKITLETIGRMDSICQNLQYKQMSMFKAFVYVPKNKLLGREEDSETADASISPSQEKVHREVAAEIAPSSISPDTPKEKEFALNETGTETAQNEKSKVEENLQTSSASSLPADTIDLVADTRPVQETDPTEIPTNPTPTNEMVTDTLPDKQQRVITDLLDLDTYESVMLYLNAMKEDGRLMYGKMSTLRSPEEAYLIIVRNGRLVTVLNKGNKKRINLKTQQTEDVQKYKGYAVIWLKVFQ